MADCRLRTCGVRSANKRGSCSRRGARASACTVPNAPRPRIGASRSIRLPIGMGVANSSPPSRQRSIGARGVKNSARQRLGSPKTDPMRLKHDIHDRA